MTMEGQENIELGNVKDYEEVQNPPTKQLREVKALNDNQEEFALIWKNVFYAVKADDSFRSTEMKTVLDNVSGYCRSGEITAIMGPSGAGKIFYSL